MDTIFFKLLPHPLELLIVRDRNRAGIGHALEFTRRILDIGLHQILDRLADGHHGPGAFGEIVHKEVIAFLGVCIEIKDLGDGGHIFFSAFPAEVGVYGESAGGRAIIAAQVEHRFVVTDPGSTWAQLILGEIEPVLAL